MIVVASSPILTVYVDKKRGTLICMETDRTVAPEKVLASVESGALSWTSPEMENIVKRM